MENGSWQFVCCTVVFVFGFEFCAVKVLAFFVALYLFYAGLYAACLQMTIDLERGISALLRVWLLKSRFLGVLWGYLVLFCVCVAGVVFAVLYGQMQRAKEEAAEKDPETAGECVEMKPIGISS